MEGKLKYVTPIFGLLFGVPVSVIYGQNIESWATSHGFDSVLTNGVQAVGNNPWGLPLLLAFLVCMGATIGLWAEFGVRRRWPSKPAKITRRVENKNFRHERVVVDGNYFVDCHFEGTTLVLLGTAAYGSTDVISGTSALIFQTKN